MGGGWRDASAILTYCCRRHEARMRGADEGVWVEEREWTLGKVPTIGFCPV